MDKNLTMVGNSHSALGLTALLSLKRVTCSKPRPLTASEIELLRQSKAEIAKLVFRRSLYIAQDLRVGDVLTPENLRCVRPDYGLSPKCYQSIAESF